MTKHDATKAIYLTGLKPNYSVVHNVNGEVFSATVPNVSIGNAIVRALRIRATQK